MQTKKENYWFMLRVLLFMNIALIAVIVLAHSNTKNIEQKKEPCCSAQKINADVLNSVTIKLM